MRDIKKKNIKEFAEQMHTIIISTANKQSGYFPQDAEDGYKVLEEMQQVLPRVSRSLMS